MKDKKKYILAGSALLVLLAAAALVAALLRGHVGEPNPNLARKRGVKATCDSVEHEALSAAMAIDGDDENRASRWSSENNREDASHYIQLEFPEEISVSFVVLKWERRNVVSYALESSLNGEGWETLQSFASAPEALHQEIVLEMPVQARYLRLSTYEVSKEEADYSDLYQNVSLYEFEVYEDKPTAYKLGKPVIEKAEGGRRLAMPEAPTGFQVSLIGADLEQVIGVDGRVYDTIQDKEVAVGCLVEDSSGREEAREVSFVIQVPAGDGLYGNEMPDTDDAMLDEQLSEEEVALAEVEELARNACPDWVIPSIAEWRGGRGVFELGEKSRIIVGADSCPPEGSRKGEAAGTGTGEETDAETATDADVQALWDVAELFNEQCRAHSAAGQGLTICKGSIEDVGSGDIYLGFADRENGLGKEGYTCDITDSCVIKAEAVTGIRWGTVTFMQILFDSDKNSAPQGQIRDYPLYEVRGFGIDAARKAISLDTLYTMMENMSWYKMNDLSLHLNDNEILATSGLADSAEHAMTADSAFRLESNIGNEKGEVLTSGEYAYTKEELDQFIRTAKTYGVTVVPEIDTPAHALSITKLYPEYALRTSNESVDQIDLGNEKAVDLVERLWREALDEESGAFREAEIVNIGMDEYYGDGEQYRQYLARINALAQESGKTVRLWGSLSNIDGTTQPSPENLQMNIWSTLWADPRKMYEAGYSLVNMQNNHLYIIPGGGYDHLDCKELYENWAPNKFYDYNQMEAIPSYSPQMLGASYMIWNDMSGRLDMGISEYDLYVRFKEPLSVLSVRFWGDSRLEEAEQLEGRSYSNCLYDWQAAAEPDYEITMDVWLEPDTDEESGTGQRQNAQTEAGTGRKQGVQTESGTGQKQGAQTEGRQDNARQAQILAEGDPAYGVWAFYAVEPETGKVGFAREGKTYTFDYVLPKGEWVNLKLVGGVGQTILYVEGKEVDSLGSDEPFEEHATFVFPLQRVGAETSHFDGRLELHVDYSARGQTGPYILGGCEQVTQDRE